MVCGGDKVHGPSLSWMVGFDDQSYIVLLHDEHWRMKVEFKGIQTVELLARGSLLLSVYTTSVSV